MNSFKNICSKNKNNYDFSTVDLIDLNNPQKNADEKSHAEDQQYLQQTWDFGMFGGDSDILSTIKPQKSRNGRPQTISKDSSGDVEISVLLGQDKENYNFDIYNKMIGLHSHKSNWKSSEDDKQPSQHCKKKHNVKEIQNLIMENRKLVLQSENLVEDNLKLTERLDQAEQQIKSLKLDQKWSNYDVGNNQKSLIIQLNLKSEEMKQAREYI